MGRQERDQRYKDKTRHGGKKKDLAKNGYICGMCGKIGSSYTICAHHTTGHKYDHDNQELLCRSCHSKVHADRIARLNYKEVTKEQIEDAMRRFDFLDDMCIFLSITRPTLYQKRKKLGLDDRTKLRGRKRELIIC